MLSNSSPSLRAVRDHRYREVRGIVLNTMNFIVLVLSAMLIVWISIDTFDKIDFLENHRYMTFQFWVCVIFIADFVIELIFTDNKWKMFRHRLLFLFLSIPWLNIIHQSDIHLSHDAIYFVRFVPLARGALAMSIVIGYLSKNAISSLFLSYIVIMIMVTYFSSLIFFQREYGLNPQVTSYWTALWWTAMNLTTVGCDISAMTVAGKIIAVAMPIIGMIMFPLFTVYLTDFVRRSSGKTPSSSEAGSPTESQPE